MTVSSPEAFLAHVLRAFGPYLDSLVVVGGFAVRLYEHHPRAAPAATRVLPTFDADLATPPRLPVRGRPLGELAEAAGLKPGFRGDRIPPVMKFVLTRPSGTAAGEAEYSLEFLTPLTGAPVDRAGRVAGTSDVQPGVTAQRLRYLDLLLETPWRVSLAGEVRIRMNGTAAWRTWLGRARRQAEVLFPGPASPGVTEAHRVLRAELAGQGVEVPSPEMIHAGLRLFLNMF
ncbi:MAG: hypothetical protein HY713_01240 [candidate division NC10 bacterium]|nr:hypothetical protein [candidate division NC10 bacterium]